MEKESLCETWIDAMSFVDDIIFAGREWEAIDGRGGCGIDSAWRQPLVDGFKEDKRVNMSLQFFSFGSF